MSPIINKALTTTVDTLYISLPESGAGSDERAVGCIPVLKGGGLASGAVEESERPSTLTLPRSAIAARVMNRDLMRRLKVMVLRSAEIANLLMESTMWL